MTRKEKMRAIRRAAWSMEAISLDYLAQYVKNYNDEDVEYYFMVLTRIFSSNLERGKADKFYENNG